MALDFGRQIAFKGGTSKKGVFKKQDLGHNAYIQRMREQLNLTNYKEVAAKTERAAKDTLSVIEQNQVKELNNKREIDQFELKKLDTAAQATEEVARQWKDYGTQEIAQIERDAEALSGLSQSVGALAKSAGGFLAKRQENIEERQFRAFSDEATGDALSLEPYVDPEQQRFVKTVNEGIDSKYKKLLNPSDKLPSTNESDNDEIALSQQKAAKHPGSHLTKHGHRLALAQGKVDESFDDILTTLKDDANKAGVAGNFTEAEYTRMAGAIMLKVYGIEGVYSRESNGIRDIINKKIKSANNKHISAENASHNIDLFDTNVTQRLKRPDLTIGDVNELHSQLTNPNTILYKDGQRLQGKAAVEHIIEELVKNGKTDLARDFIEDTKPVGYDGKELPEKNWVEKYPGLAKTLNDAITNGHNLIDEQKKNEKFIQGNTLYTEAINSWNAVEGDPNWEGSGAQLYQQYLAGDREPFLEWANKHLDGLKEYDQFHDKFSGILWTETWADPAWASTEQLITKSIKDGDYLTAVTHLQRLTPDKQQKELIKIPELDQTLSVYDPIQGRIETRNKLRQIQKDDSLPGAILPGLDQIVNKYEAQKLQLMRSYIGQGIPPQDALEKAEETMDNIFNAGLKNKYSPYYLQPAAEGNSNSATWANGTSDANEGDKDAQTAVNLINEAITPTNTPIMGTPLYEADARTFIRSPDSQWNMGNGSVSKVDLMQQYNIIKAGGMVRLTNKQRYIYDSIKYKVPGYTETQFLEDLMVGQKFPIVEGGISVKDACNAENESNGRSNATKITNKCNTNAEIQKIELFNRAVSNDLRKLTMNDAAVNSLAIDYEGAVNLSDRWNKSAETQQILNRVWSTLPDADESSFVTDFELEDDIHSSHIFKDVISCKEGTEECAYLDKILPRTTDRDWHTPGSTGGGFFFIPK